MSQRTSPARARRPEQKEERRRAILDAARAHVDEVAWGDLTMAAIAGRLGLAKGTLYLYFRTKEALFIAILREELAAFFDALETRLAPCSPREVAAQVAREVAARPLLRRLLVLLHGVLEENVGLAEIRAFKRFLLERVTSAGARLEAATPGLAAGRGAELLLRLHALVIGSQAMADPAPVVRRALKDESLAVFDIAFEPFLGSTLADLFVGMLRPPSGKERKEGAP